MMFPLELWHYGLPDMLQLYSFIDCQLGKYTKHCLKKPNNTFQKHILKANTLV